MFALLSITVKVRPFKIVCDTLKGVVVVSNTPWCYEGSLEACSSTNELIMLTRQPRERSFDW